MAFRNTNKHSLVERAQELCASLNPGESVQSKIASCVNIDVHAQHNNTYLADIRVVDNATNDNIHRLATDALKAFGGLHAGSSGSQLSIIPIEDQIRSYRNHIGMSEQKQIFISTRKESKAVITTHTPSRDYVTVRFGFGPRAQDEFVQQMIRAEHVLDNNGYVAHSQEHSLTGAARALNHINTYVARIGRRAR